jgi:hypothetical protein
VEGAVCTGCFNGWPGRGGPRIWGKRESAPALTLKFTVDFKDLFSIKKNHGKFRIFFSSNARLIGFRELTTMKTAFLRAPMTHVGTMKYLAC